MERIGRSSAINVENEKPPTAWDHHDSQSHLTLRQLIRPSLIGMAVSGCYTYDGDFIRMGRERSQGRVYRTFGRLFRIICAIVCIGAITKTMTAFLYLPAEYLQFNAVVVAWNVECFLLFLVSLKSGHSRYGGRDKAFDFWEENISPALEELGIDLPVQTVKKRQTIYLIMASMFSVFNLAGSSFMSAEIFSEGYGSVFAAPFAKSVSTIGLSMGIMVVLTLLWLFPAFYIIFISTLLMQTFEVFNNFLEKHIAQNILKMTCKFHKIRLLHLNLSKMVAELDKDFGYYFALIFVFNIAIACFILYQILKTQLETIDLVMYLFWMFSSLALLGGVSVFAAYLNESVSLNTCTLYAIFSIPHCHVYPT